jgi:hypothetical protein
MLFLAVTLGFLVENEREHIADHRKELQYIRSYIGDLHEDINQLDSLIRYGNRRNEWMDSLSYLLNAPDADQYGQNIYYYARMLTLVYPFFNTDRTIQQLKNGGNLRLIKDQKVSDAMMDYDREVRFIENIHNREEDYIRDYVKWLEENFDARVFNKMVVKGFGFKRPDDNPPLLKKDKATILELIAKIHFLKSANTLMAVNYGKLKKAAQNNLAIIKDQYGIE